jgi:hypothetical protein
MNLKNSIFSEATKPAREQIAQALTMTVPAKKTDVYDIIFRKFCDIIPPEDLAAAPISFELVRSESNSSAFDLNPKNLYTWLLLCGEYAKPSFLGNATRYITKQGAYVYENNEASFYPGHATKFLTGGVYRLAPDIQRIPATY